MAFWNKKTQQEKQDQAYVAPISRWPAAKKITKEQWLTGNLPIGWYVYDEGYGYQAIRPHPDGKNFESKWFQMYDRDQISPWLGVALPDESVQKATPERINKNGETGYPPLGTSEIQKIPQAEIPDTASANSYHVPHNESPLKSASADELEQQWAFSKMQEALKKTQTPKIKNRKRKQQISFRLSDEEQGLFLNRVRNSGMTQSEFLRQAALTSQVVVKPNNPELIQALHELTSELGRQGGLIAMWLKPNKGQRAVHQEEWDYLVKQVHYIEDIKPKLKQLMEDIANS